MYHRGPPQSESAIGQRRRYVASSLFDGCCHTLPLLLLAERRLEEVLLLLDRGRKPPPDCSLCLCALLPPPGQQLATVFADERGVIGGVTSFYFSLGVSCPLRASYPLQQRIMASWTSLRSPLLQIGRTGRESAPYLKRCQSCRSQHSRRSNSNGIATMRDCGTLPQKNSAILAAPRHRVGSR